MSTAVFTVIAANYRHHTRVLVRSLRAHQPGWQRFVLVLDRTSATVVDEDGFTTVTLGALAIPGAARLCFRYTVLELATAVKPWMFAHLFARGFERVVYLDPDIELHSPLHELDAEPVPFLILTPHLTGGIPGDGHPSERAMLQAGAYNLGFLAVARRAPLAGFLRWWQEKLEHQCVNDTARGLMLDQKWMDLAPGLFPDVSVLRHEGYNVAYWNLPQRVVRTGEAGWTVNGAPLRFFHFSGFDAAVPDRISKYSELRLAQTGDARRLFDEYHAALRAAGRDAFTGAPYAFGAFTDGTPITVEMRRAYRESLALQSACGSVPFEHPEAFAARAPRRAPALERVRPFVPDIVKRVVRKVRGAARVPRVFRASALPQGVNVVGYLGHESGIGESARLCDQACARAGLARHLLDIDHTFGDAGRAVYRASVFHVNADQMLAIRERMPAVFAASSLNVGCWHWELPELPDAWVGAAEALDEIWAPSAFIQSAVAAKTTIPVVHMPHGIEVGAIEPCSPFELGVPRGRFTFLCMFDFDSVVERKNPLAAIDAFRRGFAGAERAALLIKTSHGDRHPEALAELERRLFGLPGVFLADRVLSRARVNGLLAAADAVISLHRSEGFGLILAEAMALGKPVIATGWSGNMDFMDAASSCPVGFQLVTLDRDHGPYRAGQRWAEPDVEHAAHLMRRVVDDDGWRVRLGARAQETIRARFSPAAAGRRYRQRLAFLGLAEA